MDQLALVVVHSALHALTKVHVLFALVGTIL